MTFDDFLEALYEGIVLNRDSKASKKFTGSLALYTTGTVFSAIRIIARNWDSRHGLFG